MEVKIKIHYDSHNSYTDEEYVKLTDNAGEGRVRLMLSGSDREVTISASELIRAIKALEPDNDIET